MARWDAKGRKERGTHDEAKGEPWVGLDHLAAPVAAVVTLAGDSLIAFYFLAEGVLAACEDETHYRSVAANGCMYMCVCVCVRLCLYVCMYVCMQVLCRAMWHWLSTLSQGMVRTRLTWYVVVGNWTLGNGDVPERLQYSKERGKRVSPGIAARADRVAKVDDLSQDVCLVLPLPWRTQSTRQQNGGYVLGTN